MPPLTLSSGPHHQSLLGGQGSGHCRDKTISCVFSTKNPTIVFSSLAQPSPVSVVWGVSAGFLASTPGCSQSASPTENLFHNLDVFRGGFLLEGIRYTKTKLACKYPPQSVHVVYTIHGPLTFNS